MGKDSVLSETFALCGHNVSFAELKGIYEWQMVHGCGILKKRKYWIGQKVQLLSKSRVSDREKQITKMPE